MKYQITITTAYREAYSALFSLVVNSGLKANITAGPIDTDPDPVIPSASTSADVAPVEPAKEQINEIASLVIPPGIPEELQRQQPAKVKNLEEFLQRYCSYDDTQHTISQEILKSMAGVIEEKSMLLAYLRDDGKPSKHFRQTFNAWKKEKGIPSNGQRDIWVEDRVINQTTYPIRISLGG